MITIFNRKELLITLDMKRYGVVCDIFVCILICAVAFFDRREKSRVLYCTLVYAAVSVVLGGAMSALFVLFNRIGLDRLLGSEDAADGISVWLFALLAFLSGIGAACGGRVFKKRSAKRFCALELTFCGKSIRLRALCDSGNLLCEPISAKPCIVVELDRVCNILPRELCFAIKRGEIERLCGEHIKRIRAIPLSTLSGKSMMYALRFDEVVIVDGKIERRVDAYVALSPERIRADGASALVPAELCELR